MLQTNNNSNDDENDTQSDIFKRLEKLNQWQEEQKKLLHERQNMQRQMLGMEQRSMYQMLGLELLQPEDSLVTEEIATNNLNVGDGDHLQSDIYNQLKETSISGIDTELQGIGNEDALRIVEGEIQLIRTPQKPKRTFLRRGEGLKQRFKISPEALRLNNLPRYKYTTTHPKIRNQRRKKCVSSKTKAFNAETNDPDYSPQMLALDAHEKQFQQLLISSKNVCNSTPDMKNSTSTVSSISIKMPKVRFTDMAGKRSEDNEQEDPIRHAYESNSSSTPSISWSKVLDPQQIKPISVLMMRSKHHGYDKAPQHANVNDDSNLSIFELLEDQANDGTIDMNSSCIQTFMQRKLREKLNEVDVIHVDRRLKQAGIKPKVEELINAVELCSYEGDNDKCENTNNSKDNPIKTQVRVHFSDKHDTREYNYESGTDSSALADEVNSVSSNSTDMFQKFKNALYSALLNNVENGVEHLSVLNETDLSSAIATAVQSPSVSPLTQELQAKSILIKSRLEELEKEITTFKENNLKLLKAKQEHEMEKASFTEERLELMSRLNDSKIQMEIYLHDERMKIEDEKRNFEKEMRKLKATVSSKDRKEIVRLKQELEQMQAQLKQKEQAHASAQARLRVQVRNLERDQKQLYEDIERLTKENKKLENENVKIGRENNKKMLYEINRNIAKLAPKLTNPDENSNHHYDKSTKLKTFPSEVSTRKSFSKTFQNQLTSQKSSVKTSAPPPPSRSNSITTLEMPLTELKSNQQVLPFPHQCFGEDDDDTDDDDLTQELKLSANSKKELMQNGTQTESSVMETTKTTNEFKREIINADGSKDIWYPNGNLKKISADGMVIRMLYFNQDIKETNVNEGTVKYYYSETNTWHTTYLDGLEILEFPNGQTEHRYKNGIVEIHFPDNSIKVTNPADETKLEEWRLADGTNLLQMRNGDKILMLPNGQKEIHTKLNKRREYPDGTVKLVYPDGSQETRYSNGRVRLKDKDGILVMDTENNTL